jgi:hypothetical protein
MMCDDLKRAFFSLGSPFFLLFFIFFPSPEPVHLAVGGADREKFKTRKIDTTL